MIKIGNAKIATSRYIFLVYFSNKQVFSSVENIFSTEKKNVWLDS